MAKRIKIIKEVEIENFTYKAGKYYEVLKSFGKAMIKNGYAVAAEDLPVIPLEDIQVQEQAALQDLENEYPIEGKEEKQIIDEKPQKRKKKNKIF